MRACFNKGEYSYVYVSVCVCSCVKKKQKSMIHTWTIYGGIYMCSYEIEKALAAVRYPSDRASKNDALIVLT